MSLIRKVQSHCTGQRTSGQNTLALVVECLDHWAGPSNDWSPLAYLIGKSEPAQSRMVRRVVGKSINGWSLTKDESQPSGLRFNKKKGANQGFDAKQIEKLRGMVASKKSIQSVDIREMVTNDPVVKSTDEQLQTAVKSLVTRMSKLGVAESAIVARVQAQIKEMHTK